VARAFEHYAAALGLTVVGSFGLDRYAAEYDSVMDRIGRESGPALPSLVFYAGPPAEHLPALFAAKIAWLGDQTRTPVISAPGFAADEFVVAAGPGAESMFVIAPALPPAEERAGGHEFVEAFTTAYGAAPTDEAVYGQAAAKLVLTAVEAVCSAGGHAGRADRNSVVEAAVKARRVSVTVASGYAGIGPIEYGIYRAKGGTLELLERVLDGE
jgi:ABC-type branched-subunit amino acid transport system substrate-binding protein